MDLPRIKAWDNVIIKLMRRYKYLEKMLSEEMKKILVYLRWAQLWPTTVIKNLKDAPVVQAIELLYAVLIFPS